MVTAKRKGKLSLHSAEAKEAARALLLLKIAGINISLPNLCKYLMDTPKCGCKRKTSEYMARRWNQEAAKPQYEHLSCEESYRRINAALGYPEGYVPGEKKNFAERVPELMAALKEKR
jgi:hypothetical protein